MQVLSLSELPLAEGESGSQFDAPGWLKERDALLATVESLKGLITQMQTHRETQVEEPPPLPGSIHKTLPMCVSLPVRLRLAADVWRRGLACGAAGCSAPGVHKGAERAEERPLQPVGPAGHQRRHRPPQPAGAPTG